MEHELMELGKRLIKQMAEEYRASDDGPNQYELLDEISDATCRLAVILAAGELDNAWLSEEVQDGIAECISTTW